LPIDYFPRSSSLYGLVQSSVFCLGFNRTSFSLRQNPLHCTRPPKPPPGDVAAQKELFRSLNRFTVQPSFTNPFYARVVSSPQAPEGMLNAARTGSSSFHPASLLRLLRNRPRLLGVRFSTGTGLLPHLGSPLIPHIMSLPVPIFKVGQASSLSSCFIPVFTHHVAGRTPSGCLLLQATLREVVLFERRPVQFRTIAGIHRPAPGELARRPRTRVSQPLNTADRPTSHNAPLCNVGLCFNPCAQQKIFCQGRLALIRPAVFSRSVFAGLSTGRLTAARTASASSASSFLTCPAPPKKQTHPLGGFSSRRLLCKSLTPFPGGSPASPRFPLRPPASPLFPKAVTVSCWLLRRGRNRASPEVQPISVTWCFTSEPSPSKKSNPEYRLRFFSGLSSSVPTNSLSSAAAIACLSGLPCLQPFVWNLTPFPFTPPPRNLPPLLRRRRSGSPAGHGIPAIGKLSLRLFHECAATLRGRYLPSIGTRTTDYSGVWSLPPMQTPCVWGPYRFFHHLSEFLQHPETHRLCAQFDFSHYGGGQNAISTRTIWQPRRQTERYGQRTYAAREGTRPHAQG